MGKNSPKPPDPYQTAAAQAGANKEAIQESAKVSAVDQYGPSGSTTFQRDPKTGVPLSQTSTLGAKEQQFYDTSGDIRNSLGEKAQGFLDYLPQGAFNPSTSGDAVAKALYDRKLGMVAPQFKEADDALRLTLSERGIPVGSEIYNNEMNRMNRARGDTLAGMSQDATLAGGNEEDRQLSRALTIRGQPFNEMSAFMQGAPSINTPQFQGTPSYQMAAPDIGGMINERYNQQLAASQARNGALSSGLFGLGQAAIGGIGLSDRRFKTDIKKIGTLDNGLALYGFRYTTPNSTYQFGVMADEVEKIMPEAVITLAKPFAGKDNVKLVNYETLAGAI